MMVLARTRPALMATMVWRRSRFSILAARVPVQAPVPGIGMPTNNASAK